MSYSPSAAAAAAAVVAILSPQPQGEKYTGFSDFPWIDFGIALDWCGLSRMLIIAVLSQLDTCGSISPRFVQAVVSALLLRMDILYTKCRNWALFRSKQGL